MVRVNHARMDRLKARLEQQADRDLERRIRAMTDEELLARIAELEALTGAEEATKPEPFAGWPASAVEGYKALL